MKNYKFSVFVLSNRRPDNVKTIKALRSQGYTGKIYIILDDQDPTINEYKKNFPNDSVYVFNKLEAINLTDSADNTNNPKSVVYARNVCHRIANELDLDYFLELDDDYHYFEYRADADFKYVTYKNPKNLDRIFEIYLDFLTNTPTKSIAMAQTGDFLGGVGGNLGSKVTLARKCMNSFFCKADRPFQFYGIMNDDVNCFVLNGSRGDLFFTTTQFGLKQTMTQQAKDGLTTIYLEKGTYAKSFYSIIFHPSSVTIRQMGVSNRRIHHAVEAKFTYPKIMSQKWKK